MDSAEHKSEFQISFLPLLIFEEKITTILSTQNVHDVKKVDRIFRSERTVKNKKNEISTDDKLLPY